MIHAVPSLFAQVPKHLSFPSRDCSWRLTGTSITLSEVDSSGQMRENQIRVFSPSNMSSTSVEQLHHYAIASELPRGKVVLEIGLGEGVVQTLSRQQDKSWVWT